MIMVPKDHPSLRLVNLSDEKEVQNRILSDISRYFYHPTIKLAKKDGDMIVPMAKDEKAELLGQGAMGDVFLALDFSNNPKGAPIAIKVDNFKHENASRRNYGIKEETTPLEVDTSKNILRKTYDITGNIPILISEYRPVFLDNVLEDKSQNLTLEQRLSITSGIAMGMSEFHSKGYVCPDVKPDNIAVTGSTLLEVQLADYGGYKISNGKTTFTDSPRDNLGSVTYMPPENRSEIIGKNDEVVTGSFQSDVWIFGVNMYQLLTGKRGFFEEDELRIKTEVKNSNPHLSKKDLAVLTKSKLIEHRENLRKMSGTKKGYANLEDQLIHDAIDTDVKDKKLSKMLHTCMKYDRTKRYTNMSEVFLGLTNYTQLLSKKDLRSKKLAFGLIMSSVLISPFVIFGTADERSLREKVQSNNTEVISRYTNTKSTDIIPEALSASAFVLYQQEVELQKFPDESKLDPILKVKRAYYHYLDSLAEIDIANYKLIAQSENYDLAKKCDTIIFSNISEINLKIEHLGMESSNTDYKLEKPFFESAVSNFYYSLSDVILDEKISKLELLPKKVNYRNWDFGRKMIKANYDFNSSKIDLQGYKESISNDMVYFNSIQNPSWFNDLKPLPEGINPLASNKN